MGAQSQVREQSTPKKTKRAHLSQSDVPSCSVDEALRIPRALADEYGKQPSTPIDVAKALKLSPNASPFRMLAGASLAYGLTEGGAWADAISLSDLGRRCVAPTIEGDDLSARREALMRPRVVREFLTRYDGSRWPRDDIGQNVLETLGVPSEQTARALTLIHENASRHGLLTEINGAEYVQLRTPASLEGSSIAPLDPTGDLHLVSDPAGELEEQPQGSQAAPNLSDRQTHDELRRVFITHGRNTKIVQQIKKLLTFGGFTPVVAVEHSTAAKPLSDKVMDEMRSCGAGIVHVGTEKKVVDAEGNDHEMLNPNVLIEIGAAMALYGRKFILLVERGVSLPSNLHGLFEVRFEGDELDHESTMSLLEAFNSFKTL